MMRFRSYSALALAALAMAGCGGGSTSGGGTSTKSARIGVFVTDDLGAYDHVWVTVKSVVLVGPSGSTAVYDDPTGKLVDLAGLHGTTGSIFEFLGLGSAPAGTYTRALVTLDDNLTLFPAGATVALDRTFKGATGGSKVVEVEVEGQGEEIAGDDSLVIDFDLSRWTDDGTTVTAVAAVRGHEGLDDVARHKGEEAKGTISGLTATGFTLTGRGLPITVTIDANTAVFGGATALANGQRVEVRGAFATANQTLAATSVKVEDGTENEAEIRGSVAALGTDTFDLAIGSAAGLLPASTTVHVVPGTGTRYRGAHGATITQAEFFAALTVGEAIEAEGAYDTTSNTLTATTLKVEAENEGGHGGDDAGHGGGGHGGHGGDG